jgi:SAM-dependent methyltransferase
MAAAAWAAWAIWVAWASNPAIYARVEKGRKKFRPFFFSILVTLCHTKLTAPGGQTMSKADYERWNTRYAIHDYLFGTAPNAFLKAETRRLKLGSVVLALADGEGRNGIFLAEKGMKVHSVDFADNAITKARRLAQARNVSIQIEKADVLNWDWPEDRYDAIVAIFIQFATPDERSQLFANMKRAVKPGGLILMEGYGSKQMEYKTGGPGILEQLTTRELLEKSFSDWDIIDIAEYDCEITEGKRHTGMSALTDLVAQKPSG